MSEDPLPKRIKIEGLPEAKFELPPMHKVWKNASEAPKLRENGGVKPCLGQVARGSLGMMPVPLVYNLLVPNLFRFAYACHTDDVPPVLYAECFWALETFLGVIQEASEDQLRKCEHILPHQTSTEAVDTAMYIMNINTCAKAAKYAMTPQVDRPEKAAEHLKALRATNEQRKKKYPMTIFHESNDRFMDIDYGVALARMRNHDDEAKELLERWISGADDINSHITTRVYLARIYSRIGESDKAKELETYLVKWFKKNPRLIPDKRLEQIFKTDVKEGEKDPVLEGLGGLQWLEKRRNTEKTNQRLMQACRVCRKREPEVKLSLCARCKHIYYCSKTCQKQDWPHHKEGCGDMASTLKRVEQLKLAGDTDAARRLSEWNVWRIAPHECNDELLIHALDLHRDKHRGWTHIVVKHVEHVPNARRPRDHFRILQCGVFRISDIGPEVEDILGLPRGSARSYCDEVIRETIGARADASEYTPLLDLTFGKDIQAWFGSCAMANRKLRTSSPRNPNWRDLMNKSASAPLPLDFRRAGIKDAELE